MRFAARLLLLAVFLVCPCLFGATADMVAGQVRGGAQILGEARVSSVTGSYRLSVLMGEPLVSGNFAWEGTGRLHPSTRMALACTSSDNLRQYYVFVDTLVPEPGKGAVDLGATPGSPAWGALFHTSPAWDSPCLDSRQAKDFWTGRYSVTGITLIADSAALEQEISRNQAEVRQKAEREQEQARQQEQPRQAAARRQQEVNAALLRQQQEVRRQEFASRERQQREKIRELNERRQRSAERDQGQRRSEVDAHNQAVADMVDQTDRIARDGIRDLDRGVDSMKRDIAEWSRRQAEAQEQARADREARRALEEEEALDREMACLEAELAEERARAEASETAYRQELERLERQEKLAQEQARQRREAELAETARRQQPRPVPAAATPAPGAAAETTRDCYDALLDDSAAKQTSGAAPAPTDPAPKDASSSLPAGALDTLLQ